MPEGDMLARTEKDSGGGVARLTEGFRDNRLTEDSAGDYSGRLRRKL